MRSATTSAARRSSCPSCPAGCCRCSCSTSYEGLEAQLLQDFTRAQRDAYVEANAAAVRALLPADLVFANHVLLGGAGRRRARRALRASRRTAPSSSTRCAATSELVALGRRGARAAPRPCTSARSTSAACSRTSSVTSTACTRCRRASTSTSSCPRPRDAGARGADRARRADDPGDGDERHPDAGNAERFARVLRRRRADRPLLRQADREQGRAGAARGAARPRRARGDRRLRRLPRGARGARAAGDALHRRARAPPPRAPAAARDVAVVPSIFPEAFGMVAAEAAAAGVPPLVADHSGLAEVGGGHRRGVSADAARTSSSFPSRRRRTRCASALRGAARAARDRAPCARPRGAPAVERSWSWAGVAERLLEPLNRDRLPRWATSRRSATRSCWRPRKAALRGGRRTSPSRSRRSSRSSIPTTLEPRQPLRGRAGRPRAAPSSSRTSSAS